MPVVIWSAAASLIGIVAGMIYEKESNKKVVESITKNDTPKLNWCDKAIMAAAGVAAYWIYRGTK